MRSDLHKLEVYFKNHVIDELWQCRWNAEVTRQMMVANGMEATDESKAVLDTLYNAYTLV